MFLFFFKLLKLLSKIGCKLVYKDFYMFIISSFGSSNIGPPLSLSLVGKSAQAQLFCILFAFVFANSECFFFSDSHIG